MSKLVFGCGYLGTRVVALWQARGETVFAVTRHAHRCAELEQQGLSPIVADVTDPPSLADLPRADMVLFAVGFDRAAGNSIHEVYAAGLNNVLDALPDEPRVIYISSTGVYSQDDGSWVDEQSPCHPVRDGGRACLAAEQQLVEHPRGARATVLRLGGIYGPGRIPRGDSLRAGQPLPARATGYLNLIHVEDAATVVDLVAARDGPMKIYNVTDGSPVIRRDYFQYVAELLQAPSPTFDEDKDTREIVAAAQTSVSTALA